jgi:hypothetical protein
MGAGATRISLEEPGKIPDIREPILARGAVTGYFFC